MRPTAAAEKHAAVGEKGNIEQDFADHSGVVSPRRHDAPTASSPRPTWAIVVSIVCKSGKANVRERGGGPEPGRAR